MLVIIVMAANSNASAQAYERGDNVISAGYGIASYTGFYSRSLSSDGYSDIESSGTGPVYLKFSHAMSDKISLGLNFAYEQREFSYKESDDFYVSEYTYYETVEGFSLNARLDWHFATSEKVDPYFGLGFGFKDSQWSYKSNNPFDDDEMEQDIIPLGFETTLGLRYFVSQNVGLYAEVGVAKSIFQFGVCGKF